jgi:ribosomal protein L37AE/L43A
MTTNATVSCPRCSRKQPRRTPDAIYWCENCRCQFDDDPDEGGDYSSRNPAARLEREERRRV